MMENEGTIRIKITGQQRKTQNCCNGLAVLQWSGLQEGVQTADSGARRGGGVFLFLQIGEFGICTAVQSLYVNWRIRENALDCSG